MHLCCYKASEYEIKIRQVPESEKARRLFLPLVVSMSKNDTKLWKLRLDCIDAHSGRTHYLKTLSV